MTSRPTDAIGYSRYGASMGRPVDRVDGHMTGCKLYRVRLNRDGYDNGGAYWGAGLPLYCLTDADANAIGFQRAPSRVKAFAALSDRFDFTLARAAKGGV